MAVADQPWYEESTVECSRVDGYQMTWPADAEQRKREGWTAVGLSFLCG